MSNITTIKYEDKVFSIGDTVAYTKVAKKIAINDEWEEKGFIKEGAIEKEHIIIGFSDKPNGSGDYNPILKDEKGNTNECAPDHLYVVKKADE